MKRNAAVVKVKRKMLMMLGAVAVLELAAILFLVLFFRQAAAQDSSFSFVRNIVVIFFIGISLLIDLAIYIGKVRKLNKILHVTPVPGTVEDMILTMTKGDETNRYTVDLVVRNSENGKLYFTYGSNNLSWYHQQFSQTNQVLNSVRIVRKDRTEVGIGDTVLLYIAKIITPSVEVRQDDGNVLIDGKVFPYRNQNSQYDCTLFRELVMYQGAVQVEEFSDEQAK